MRERIVEHLTRSTTDSPALEPVRREQFLVYIMGPYRTFDVHEMLPDDASADTEVPSFATWDEAAGDYSEDDVLRLLHETRDCLRDRGFNAFLAIDVGTSLDEMDAATQSIAFARPSNAVIFVAPQVGDNLGVGIEIGSVLEDMLASDDLQGEPAGAERPTRSRRFMVATEPDVRSAMLASIHARWEASVRMFSDVGDLCRLSAQFATHIQNEELYGSLDQI